MPSLVKKLRRGRAYYYLVYSARVNGKPRIVRQVYLGPSDQVAARLAAQVQPTSAPPGSHTVLRELGASSALWDLVQKLGIIDLIDSEVGPHRTELSVGQYLAVAAINRCIAPTSKKAMKEWYAGSYLSSLLPARSRALEGQRFWDAMSRLEESHINAVEEKLLVRVRQLYDLDVRNVMYDATNFFTYINTQTDSVLAQRGHNKAKRDDLRQVSVSLLASLDFGVPLLHHCYPGQVPDATEFGVVLDRLVERLRRLSDTVDVTIVFDKGNNSEDNFKRLDEMCLSSGGKTKLHYVGSLPPSQHRDLLDIPLSRFTLLQSKRLRGVTAWRSRKKVFGKERTLVVTWNPRLAVKQEAALLTYLKKKSKALSAIQERLHRLPTQPKSAQARTTVDTVRREVQALLKRKEVAHCVAWSVEAKDGLPRLEFSVNQDAIEDLKARLYGRNLIVTDHDDWTSEKIVLAYRYQYKLEHQFKNMKNPQALCWWPLLHWTDQKIRVHAFYCVLGLLLLSLLQRELAQKGMTMPIPRMLSELRGINEATQVLQGDPSTLGASTCTTTLTRMNHDQARMYDILDLSRLVGSGVLGNTKSRRRKPHPASV